MNSFKTQWLLRVPPGLTFKTSAFCPQIAYVFFMILRAISNEFPIQHQPIGFYNRDGVFLLPGKK
jgi:hypothetical protein